MAVFRRPRFYGAFNRKRWIGTKTASGGNNFSQPLSDSVSSSDAIVKSPVKILSDTASTSDATAKSITHPLSDSVATSQSVLLTEGNLSDLITDHQDFTLHINDVATASDGFSTTVVFIRGLTDTATVSEGFRLSPGPVKSDAVTVSDAVIKAFTKRLSDSASGSDATARYLNGVLITSPVNGASVIFLLNGHIAVKVSNDVYLPL